MSGRYGSGADSCLCRGAYGPVLSRGRWCGRKSPSRRGRWAPWTTLVRVPGLRASQLGNGPSAPGGSWSPPERRLAGLDRHAGGAQNCTSRGSGGTAGRTPRSARTCSSETGRWSGTCARSSPSCRSRRVGSSAQPLQLRLVLAVPHGDRFDSGAAGHYHYRHGHGVRPLTPPPGRRVRPRASWDLP